MCVDLRRFSEDRALASSREGGHCSGMGLLRWQGHGWQIDRRFRASKSLGTRHRKAFAGWNRARYSRRSGRSQPYRGDRRTRRYASKVEPMARRRFVRYACFDPRNRCGDAIRSRDSTDHKIPATYRTGRKGAPFRCHGR